VRVTIRLSLLVLALLAGCANSHETRRGDSVDVSGFPPDIRQAYRVFAVRCSRCHTLARPLNARIHDPQHWVRYVTRMRRQPGSGIDHTNADVILRFLLFYTDEVNKSETDEAEPPPPLPTRPPEAPPPIPSPGSIETDPDLYAPERPAPDTNARDVHPGRDP
jgi:hypothetical protein